MRFFTPELYLQFNSRDEAEAERANKTWEQAILAYKQQLESTKELMPSQIVALSELCLHDAEVLARSEVIQASWPEFYPEVPFLFPFSLWSAVAVVTVQIDGEILSLFYSLWDRIKAGEAPENWPFSKLREHWLYDEIHVQSERRGMKFTHSILLSTGVVLDIPFVSVVMHRFPVPRMVEGSAKQSA